MINKTIKIAAEDLDKDKIENELPEKFQYEWVENTIPNIKITNSGLSLLPDFSLESIPLIYTQNIAFSKKNLEIISSLFLEETEPLALEPPLSENLFSVNFQFLKCISQDMEIPDILYDYYQPQQQFEEYAVEHNKAMLLHYNQNPNPDVLHHQFQHAAYLAPDATWLAFTNYIYMLYLLENNEIDHAIAIVKQITRRNIDPSIKVTILLTLYKFLALNEQNTAHSEVIDDIEIDISQFLNTNRSTIDFYTTKSLYKESQGYFDEAALILQQLIDDQGIREEEKAQLQKSLADLYLKMAQHGDQSKYLVAQKVYQEALRYYTKQNYPELFAECQMNLGIIYAEMPSYDVKKQVYAGLSQSAFTEALQIFSKENYPETYAMVATNFSNAMIRLLPEIDSNRFDKISTYLQDALRIRSAEKFPEERAISLLSLLNLQFHRLESAEEIDPIWFTEMENLAKEIKQLTENEFLVEMANDALSFIQKNAFL